MLAYIEVCFYVWYGVQFIAWCESNEAFVSDRHSNIFMKTFEI